MTVAAAAHFDKNFDLGQPDRHVAILAFMLDLDDVAAELRDQ